MWAQWRRGMEIVSSRRLVAVVGGAMLGLTLAAGGAVAWAGIHPALLTLAAMSDAAVAGLLWFVCVPLSAPYLDDMARMRAGAAWAHWHYDRAAWATAFAAEAREERRDAQGIAFVTGVIGLCPFLCALLQAAAAGGATLLLAGLLMLGIGLLVPGATVACGRGHRARRAPTGEVYISALGVYAVPGGYTPLAGYTLTLEAVALEAGDPPCLRFCGMAVTYPNGVPTRVPRDIGAVGVPPGAAEEARQLVARFRAEVLPAGPAAVPAAGAPR